MSEAVRVDGRLARVVRMPLLAPLRARDYRLVWFGESVSLLGDQFHLVALSWLVLGLTGSGLALGTVLLAASVPRGVFLLVGGVLSDRISPRVLMLWSNVVRAVVTSAIAALVFGGRVEIWHLVIAATVFGTVDAVFFPAIGTIVARLVPVDQLGPANAMLQGTQQLMGTVGPAVAGIAIATIGVGAAFVIDSASFVVAATAVWLVRAVATGPVGPQGEPGPELLDATQAAEDGVATEANHGSMAASMLEGVRAVLGDPMMRMLVLLSTAFNLAFTGPVVVGLPWLVQVRFGGDATMLGLLLAAFGGGSLLGVVIAGAGPRVGKLGSLIVVVATALGIGLGVIGLASAPVAGVTLFLIGVGVGFLNVTIISWAQARTEPHLLGRTMSFLMLGSVVGAPLSLALAGAIIDLNATLLFLVAGALVVVTALAGLASGLPRRMV